MNNTFATTGLLPFCVGSIETFQVQTWLNGLPWDLTGGSATLNLLAPDNSTVSIPGTIAGGGATAPWTVTGPAGTWTRSWTVQDVIGRKQVGRPIAFAVETSP